MQCGGLMPMPVKRTGSCVVLAKKRLRAYDNFITAETSDSIQKSSDVRNPSGDMNLHSRLARESCGLKQLPLETGPKMRRYL